MSCEPDFVETGEETSTYDGNAYAYKLIYIISAPEYPDHVGLYKIGEATLASTRGSNQLPPNCEPLNAAAHHRVKQYTQTAGFKYELEHTELAESHITMDDGSAKDKAFSDNDVHRVLFRSGYHYETFGEEEHKTEWFKVSLEAAINAIGAVKDNRQELYPSEKVGEPPAGQPQVTQKIALRQEQQEAVDKALTVFKRSDKMLWDCKMRFGKTVSAYELIKEGGFQKTLIVTHRPVVEEGWKNDHDLIFGKDSEHLFVTKKINSAAYEYDPKIDSENDRTLRTYDSKGLYFSYFASMQDLRGSKCVGGKFDKNHAVFDLDWDLIIYDEAHEGTQTDLGQKVMDLLEEPKNGKTPKILSLSGTPYNLLNQYEDDNVYIWDYVMEQRRKQEFAELHPGRHNPYADLPEMRILTFDMQKVMSTSYRYASVDAAFNFKEFFRTWTGKIEYDFQPVPPGAAVGDFVHSEDVAEFLDLITTESGDSNYPFSTESYRDVFRHTFWMVPGVKEAKALSRMLSRHPVFKDYKIANVAGEGDQEKDYEDALAEVQSAIRNNDYTITISCGRLTTGVTVPEWSAVMMLAGSNKTSASGYMQTIFRVQSAGSVNGKQKQIAYVFDFAPDRALNVLTQVHSLSGHGKRSEQKARVALGEFINFCPVIAVKGTRMVNYDVDSMMRQIKRMNVDKAIESGFEDETIYNEDVGIVMDDEDAKIFNALAARISGQNKSKRPKTVTINYHGLTDEEYKEVGKAKRKRKRELTPEEKELLEKERELKRQRDKIIRLLREISIRLPLLIYGAGVDLTEDIHMKDFIDIVDDESWQEFMPQGVDKEIFQELVQYYDEDVVIAAGARIRQLAKAADELPPTKRVERIAEIFSYFRNPDKETVLTPWRVVNMHMGDTLGGFNFFEEGYPTAEQNNLESPRLIENAGVTADLFLDPNVQLLEMNSKSGLYPLYLTYSMYAMQLPEPEERMDLAEAQKLWQETLTRNIFVLCRTKMAVSITRRTLAGYQEDWSVNVIYLSHLIERMKSDEKRLARKLTNPETWHKEGERMKFNAIVGNPPYQLSDGGNKASATPIYNYFVTTAMELHPRFISMIMPAKWYSGGRNLEAFREIMLKDNRMYLLHDFNDSNDCFDGVDIAGGLCYFLWDATYSGNCTVTNHEGTETYVTERNLNDEDIFVRNGKALPIINKVRKKSCNYYDERVSTQRPFGLRTFTTPTDEGDVSLRYSGGTGPFKRGQVTAGAEWIDKWKVIMSYLTYDHAGRPDKNGQRRIFSTTEILPPGTVCTETYLVIDAFDSQAEAENLFSYLKTKFVRFLVAQVATTQHLSRSNFSLVPIQDFSKPWTDEELYKKYELTEEEIEFIESTIKPMK